MPSFKVEIEVAGINLECHITHTPGSPARGPSYSHGGLPAEPDETYCEQVFIIGYDGGTQVRIDVSKLIDELNVWEKIDELACEAAESQIEAYYSEGEDAGCDDSRSDAFGNPQ